MDICSPLSICITCAIHKGEVIFMHKIATVNARMEPELKDKAETIFHKVGLSSAEAMRLFYN